MARRDPRAPTVARPTPREGHGAIVRRHAGGAQLPATLAAGAPAPPAPAWGRRLLGTALLLATVGLVSCQALISAFAPAAYG
jgi:hypothetical protein